MGEEAVATLRSLFPEMENEHVVGLLRHHDMDVFAAVEVMQNMAWREDRVLKGMDVSTAEAAAQARDEAIARQLAGKVDGVVSDDPIRPHWLPTEGPGNLQVVPAKWGMTLKQFAAFIMGCCQADWRLWSELEKSNDRKAKGYVNLYQLSDNYVKPWTRNTGNGVALLMNSSEPLLADLMVSHAWSECILETLMAIMGQASTIAMPLEAAMWFCIFALYQPGGEVGDCGPDIDQQVKLDPFGSVLASKPRFGMIVVHTSRAELYDRLWCCYELDEAERHGVTASGAFSLFHLIAADSNWVNPLLYDDDPSDSAQKGDKGKGKALDRFRDVNLMHVSKKDLRVDTSLAKASSESDTKMIRSSIEERGGFAKLDTQILRFREESSHKLKAVVDGFVEWAVAPGRPEWREDTMGFVECAARNAREAEMGEEQRALLITFFVGLSILNAAKAVGLKCLAEVSGLPEAPAQQGDLFVNRTYHQLEMDWMLMQHYQYCMQYMEEFLSVFDPTRNMPPPFMDEAKYVLKAGESCCRLEANKLTKRGRGLQMAPDSLELIRQCLHDAGNMFYPLPVGLLEMGAGGMSKFAAFASGLHGYLKLEVIIQSKEEAKRVGPKMIEAMLALNASEQFWEDIEDLKTEFFIRAGEIWIPCDRPNKDVFPIRQVTTFRHPAWDAQGITNAFRTWDTDASGTISLEEMSQLLLELDPSFSRRGIEAMFSAADGNKDGQIDYQEFVRWIIRGNGWVGSVPWNLNLA